MPNLKLMEIATVIGEVESRAPSVIWNQLRGRTLGPLIRNGSEADRNTPVSHNTAEIGAARFLMAALDRGIKGAELAHLNTFARAEKQRGSKIINLDAAIANPQANWVFEIVRFRDPTDGELKSHGTWIEDGFRFGSPEPLHPDTVYAGPIEHIEQIMFSNIWRPIAARLAQMES